MKDNERILSDYIDSLNSEKKPEEHNRVADSPELEELLDTVRLVRTLKEPVLPSEDYPGRLACIVRKQLPNKESGQKRKRKWLFGTAAAAVLCTIFVLTNFVLNIGSPNIAYAMEQSFSNVKAYHGVLKIDEINGEGKQVVQAELEVWADKAGRYYVKELEGAQTGLITVNNGEKKWQVRPGQNQVYLFPAFPDPYMFTFELGKEVNEVKGALETKVVGEEKVAGRDSYILEVSPKGGLPYRIWADKETKLPLMKQYAMQNALELRATYTKIDYSEAIPQDLMAYSNPQGLKEVDTNPEQLVASIEEADAAAGITTKVPESLPAGYMNDSMAVELVTKAVKLSYSSEDGKKKIILMQGKASGELKPASMAIQGKVGSNTAEIQSPVEGTAGILSGGGAYAGVTGISSVRWQQDGSEYAVIGNIPLEELGAFIKCFNGNTLEIPSVDVKAQVKPKVDVPVDMEVEKGDQKNADSGHSPWKLDPVYVAQIFVSLKISPEGIVGEPAIKTEDLKITKNTGTDAVVEVSGDKTPVKKVYLKKLIRQDSTGIWTVVGYDPAGK